MCSSVYLCVLCVSMFEVRVLMWMLADSLLCVCEQMASRHIKHAYCDLTLCVVDQIPMSFLFFSKTASVIQMIIQSMLWLGNQESKIVFSN